MKIHIYILWNSNTSLASEYQYIISWKPLDTVWQSWSSGENAITIVRDDTNTIFKKEKNIYKIE